MNFVLHPWQFLLAVIAGWINDEQQKQIDYLRTENQILKEKLGKKRILLNDDQRRRLAVKGKVLGRKLLSEIGCLFTADTILRWHRQLVAEKWDHSDKRKQVGRPATPQEVVDVILQFARDNPTWGYDRIADALANLGHTVSDQTVGNILKANGIEPVPERKHTTTWATFLKAHWDQLAAIDFTTVAEVLLPRSGLRRRTRAGKVRAGCLRNVPGNLLRPTFATEIRSKPHSL